VASRTLAVTGVQYAPAFANVGYNTVEVFIENGTGAPVTFTGGDLDGVKLPPLDFGAAQSLAAMLRPQFEGVSGGKPPTSVLSDGRITWWQFYPSATVQPGETVLCQINLKENLTRTRKLALYAKDADSPLYADILHYRAPGTSVNAVTWSKDGAKMFVQYSSANSTLRGIALNGTPMQFKVLEPQAGMPVLPFLAAVPLQSPVKAGTTILLKLTFEDGSVHRELFRAAPGVVLDAYGSEKDGTLPSAMRAKFHLDDKPVIAYLNFDVACDDTRVHRPGDSAMRVTAARLDAFKKQPGRLSAIDFCTSTTRRTWNIYAHLTDAVFVKPYRLGWGTDPTRFIEEEEECVTESVFAAAPRPSIWIPERFKRNERHIEGTELRVMAWNSLMAGARGIRYHFWKDGVTDPFRDWHGIEGEMQSLNADIRRIDAILSPLVAVSAGTDDAQGVRVREAWSGDVGVLLFVRDLRYTTDGKGNNNGKSPRFKSGPVRDITVAYTLPPWLDTVTSVTDPLTGEPLPFTTEQRTVTVTFPLNLLQLIWIKK